MSEVVLGVQDLADLILELTVNLDGFGRWWLAIGEPIRDGGFNLRDVEYRMNKAKFVRKSETDRVTTDAVDDLERAEVRFG